MSPESTPRSPRTPEEQAAHEGARILQRMSQSGTISSPSRAPRPSPSAMPPQAIDTPLENDSEEEEAKQRFELYRAGHRARTYTSPLGKLPSGAVYSDATGRLSVPLARYEHPGGEGDDESDEERSLRPTQVMCTRRHGLWAIRCGSHLFTMSQLLMVW